MINVGTIEKWYLLDNIVGDEQVKQKRAGVVSRRQRAQGKK